ncbi:hypothetical protein ACFL0M_07670 [Thermodesulfobacteriota bacterium]
MKRFLKINLGEVEEKRFQLFDPTQAEIFGIVWNPASGISALLRQALVRLRRIKKRFRTNKKGFEQQPVKTCPHLFTTL